MEKQIKFCERNTAQNPLREKTLYVKIAFTHVMFRLLFAANMV